MPELRLMALEDVLANDQIVQLTERIREFGAQISETDDTIELDDSLSDEQLADFMDRLEAHDIACDIYLPSEFDGRVDVGDRSVGSVHALSDALEELREELDIDGDASPEGGDDPMDLEVIEEQLAYAWQVFNRAASACLERHVPLHVIS